MLFSNKSEYIKLEKGAFSWCRTHSHSKERGVCSLMQQGLKNLELLVLGAAQTLCKNCALETGKQQEEERVILIFEHVTLKAQHRGYW